MTQQLMWCHYSLLNTSETYASETIVRLTLLQNQRDLPNDIQTQAISSA